MRLVGQHREINQQATSSANRHNIYALPNGSGTEFTCVLIGPDGTQQLALPYMLNVSPYGDVKSGISGIAIDANTDGVFGGNNNGWGVRGQTYYGGAGIRGEAVYSNAAIAGQFKHFIIGGTALQVDQGNVRLNGGNTQISNALTNVWDPLLQASYVGTDSYDHIAIQGTSVPQPYYGIGGWFTGGYIGMHGEAWGAGTGRRIGGQFVATGGTTNRAIEATVNSNTGDDWAGWFNGRLWSTAGYLPSDDKLKKEQRPLEGAIAKVMKLKPVSYLYRTEEYAGMSLPLEKQNGMIAQDIEMVFPELVCETAVFPQKKGPNSTQTEQIEKIKGVNYLALIPVLTRAIQEQQQTIEEMRAQINDLKNMR